MEEQYLNIFDLFDELNALAANNTKEHKMSNVNGNITIGSFIVGSIAPGIGLSFSRNPVVHYSAADARSECERLAKLNPGKTFFFVEVKGGAVIPEAKLTKF